MNSAIIINLDYERYGSEVCSRFWAQVENHMLRAGFVKNKRLFLTNLSKDDACLKAKSVIATVQGLFVNDTPHVLELVSEFYGLDYQNIHDLLTPASDAIEVDFVDTGTFRSYFT